MTADILLLDSIFTQNLLPSHDDLFNLAESVSTILEEEKSDYRPEAFDGNAGSLIDLRNSNLPTIIIPDLHARPEFLKKILHFVLPESFTTEGSVTVFEALSQKLINLIFLGDALHTEKVTKMRWMNIQLEFDNGNYTGKEMQQEMAEGLSLLQGLYYLKMLFPENFHFLKGNHENITNRSSNGDFAFKKYVDEGWMVMNFVREYYGDDVLYMISCVEDSLPLLAAGQKFVVSHAEPRTAYSYSQIINARSDDKVVLGLTWTANDEADKNSALQILINLLGEDKAADSLYFGGHRPVNGTYNLRQEGKFIQIHNPVQMNIALVPNNRKFNPETDIVSVIKKES